MEFLRKIVPGMVEMGLLKSFSSGVVYSHPKGEPRKPGFVSFGLWGEENYKISEISG